MAQKTIGLREDVYDDLKDAKRENESFSDTVHRLLSSDTPDESTTESTDTDAVLGRIDDLETTLKRDLPRETAEHLR